ncbi:MAG TPA: NAD-dependent succinate-semialdehyde dehydrogenase [Chloroflexota bacterium]|nr:NAD-dependent succinate-semialdehyde dehydrogenase [Chloroflexota bacterium]
MATKMAVMQSINPATEEVLKEYPEMPDAEVDTILAEAHAAYLQWRTTSFAERAAKLRNAASYLRSHKAEIGRLVTLEMGKPIAQAEGEVEKSALGCDYYADNAEKHLADEHIATNARDSYVAYTPVGVVLAIMPWNFPIWQVFRPIAPAVMAGNALVLKHASNVPQCALAIEEVMRAAGFPDGLFRTLLVGGRRVERIIENPHVRVVTLTGSEAAGRQVAGTAGRALKKTVLELGGSDPFIVLADADLDLAAKVGAVARNQNSGQSCIAAKRFIVEESVASQFEERFVEAVKAMKVGDPLDRTTGIGPLARNDLRDTLEAQVKASVAQGAKVAIGGERTAGRGYYFAPTILTDVTPEMTVFREETFGPAAAVIRVKNAEQAIEYANDSVYGLGASIFSQDLEKAQKLARIVESGQVFINGMVASDPRLPFGGVKASGYGRELGIFGIREMVNIQTIWVGPAK